MEKYINLKMLLDLLNMEDTIDKVKNENIHYKQGYLTGLMEASLLAQSTAFVKIVRCRECKYKRGFFCGKWHYAVSNLGFCSHGEKEDK